MNLMLRSKSILALGYKDELVDVRIFRELSALSQKGYKINYICIKSNRPGNQIKGLNLHMVNIAKKRGGRVRYIFQYLRFGLYSFFMTNYLFFKNRPKIIIPFVMPEYLVLNCLIPKLFGAKVLMDWEDPSFEVFQSNFKIKSHSILLTVIRLFEKMSVAIADEVITPNEGFKRAFCARGLPSEKIHIVMNAPDMNIFGDYEAKDIQPDTDRFVILYSGSLIRRYGLDTLVQALPLIVPKVPTVCLRIVGGPENSYLNECKTLWEELEVSDFVDYLGYQPIKNIPLIIKGASVGVVPNREDSFTKINFAQRILEFGLMRRPVVVPRLAGIEDYMDDESVCFYEAGNHVDLARKIIDLYLSPVDRKNKEEKAYNRVKKINWVEPFIEIVEKLDGA